MGPEVIITNEQIKMLPDNVRLIYSEFKKFIRPDSDLQRYLVLCSNVFEVSCSQNLAEHRELHNAQRILSAIVNCYELLMDSEERLAFKGLIAQIEANSLGPKTQGGSLGLNAVFELEFLQYVRHRKIKARLGEPDIVLSAPFGDYYVACKSINSLKNIESNLDKAASQIALRGVGVVALNFEHHVYYDEVFMAHHPRQVAEALDNNLTDLYRSYEELFKSKLAAGAFDGIAIQICCVASVQEQEVGLSTMIHNVYYSRANLQSTDSIERFKAFRGAMQGPISFFG